MSYEHALDNIFATEKTSRKKLLVSNVKKCILILLV